MVEGHWEVATQDGDLDPGTRVSGPRWIAETLRKNAGRDPLGLQTATQDRFMPILLPGILELSRRARYFSFHAFLLDEYRRRRQRADAKALASFIRRREWELGLAVQRCPNDCGSSPVGSRRLGNIPRGDGPFPRGESVESPLGGYGLYYRSPMLEFGIVAKAGTLLRHEPIPIDVLHGTERAHRLAETFRDAVADTAYYQHQEMMWGSGDLPAEVIDEYAAVACLCRLRELPAERDAVHDALFGTDPIEDDQPTDRSTTDSVGDAGEMLLGAVGVEQRRRSVGHYLSLIPDEPRIMSSQAAYRQALWSLPTIHSNPHAVIADEWSALVAKDVWQESICSVWSEFCRNGLARTRELDRGLSWSETHELARGLAMGPPALNGDTLTAEVAADLTHGTVIIADSESSPVNVADAAMETLRDVTQRLDSATSGLVVLLELTRRAKERTGIGWRHATRVTSTWQPSLADVLDALDAHLESEPTINDTLWWLVSSFVLPIHERIAYSKLPEFTFRFRWEDGLLRFYDLGIGRFPLAGIRHESLGSLTWDLALWGIPDDDGSPALTARGAAFINEVLA